MMDTSPRPAAPFACGVCGDEFTRLDHLTRHARAHNADKPFICPVCSKPFGRRDSLARHCRGHSASKPTGHRTIFNRISRACANCSKSKVRCDGAQPCQHCATRNLHCVREPRHKRRVKGASSRSSQDLSGTRNPRNDEEELGHIDPALRSLSESNDHIIVASVLPNAEKFGSTASNVALNDGVEANPPTNMPTSTARDPRSGQRSSPVLPSPTQDTASPSLSVEASQQLPRDGIHQATEQLTSNFGRSVLPPSPTSPCDGQLDPSDENPGEHASGFDSFTMNRGGDLLESSNQEALVPCGLDPLELDALLNRQFNITDWMSLDFPDIDDFPFNDESIVQAIDSSLSPYGTAVEQQATHIQDTLSFDIPSYSLQVNSGGPNQSRPAMGIHIQSPLPSTEVASGENDASALSQVGNSIPEIQPHKTKDGLENGRTPQMISFPDFTQQDHDILQAEDFGHVEFISQESYDSILQAASRINTGRHVSKRLRLSTFPSIRIFNCFVQLYFEYFQAIFPVLHQPTFTSSRTHWLEVLAVASIGCRFSKAPGSLRCAQALSALLRGSIYHMIAEDESIIRTKWLSTSILLDYIGMMYSGDKMLLEIALVTGNSIATQCRRNNYLKASPSIVNVDENTFGSDLEGNWIKWSLEEGRRRIGYGCWILQCQLPLHFDLPASMKLGEIQQPLPCPDAVWRAPNASAWKPLFLKYQRDLKSSPLTMSSIFHDLIAQKTMSGAIGDFGRLVLVHAIYETTFEMRAQFKNPLYKGLSGNFPFADETVFQNWQDRAGTLLEIILSPLDEHDVASALSHQGATSNWQLRHSISTTAHHVSLLNFAPISELLNFAGSGPNSSEKRDAEQHLLEWAADDNGKTARRAVLHACVIFTLIRFQSCYSFHEPIAFLVASLTIWSYNYLVPQDSSYENQETIRLDKIWNLDAGRPWLDGDPGEVRGYLTDVGNINHPGAGSRLLQVAHQSLLKLPAWGLSQGFAKFLKSLQG